MTPEQAERFVVAAERIAAALTALAKARAPAPAPAAAPAAKPPARERFRAALPRVKNVAGAVSLWERAVGELTEAERTELWKVLVDHVGRVAKIRNAEAVLRRELAKGAPSR